MKKVPEPKTAYTFMVRPSLLQAVREDADRKQCSYSAWLETAIFGLLPAPVRVRLASSLEKARP